jgi:large subunit ribosomal protein L4
VVAAKQKGTGRARQGSTRAPQFAGGGVVHGPKPRDYDQRTPKKMKAAALKGALSDRARNNRVHVVAALASGEKPSTKAAIKMLTEVTNRPRILVVLERSDQITWLSLRNAPHVHLVAVDQLNTYDVLRSDDVVFTKSSYEAFIVGLPAAKFVKTFAAKSTAGSGTDVTAGSKKAAVVTTKKETSTIPEPGAEVTVATIKAGDFVGAAEPLEGGAAPEGFLIKGNKDSMKFHAPGGRWYDATVAEVWFKTTTDAKAAGFVEAGSKASIKAPQAEEESK